MVYVFSDVYYCVLLETSQLAEELEWSSSAIGSTALVHKGDRAERY